MIERILPAPVASAEVFGDDPAATLLPGERAIIARAVESRRREFTTARGCARSALAGLGLPPVPVLPGPVVGGSPLNLLHGRWLTGHGLLIAATVVPV